MEGSLDDLREELAGLEGEEGRLSAERSRLHDQIDFGGSYAGASTRSTSPSGRDRSPRPIWEL